MAVLVHRDSVSQYEVLIGRARPCQRVFGNKLVSSTHTMVRWTGTKWLIHDLDSRDGAFVDSQQLTSGEHKDLHVGISIAFGDTADLVDLKEFNIIGFMELIERRQVLPADNGFQVGQIRIGVRLLQVARTSAHRRGS